MTDAAWMAEVRAGVNDRLTEYFEAKRKEAEQLSNDSVRLVDAVRSLTMRGGKRLRAAVITAGFVAIDGKGDRRRCTDVSASLELLQSYLLIHDDWMDNDSERRGGPSVHIELARIYENKELGNSLAILAGDLASAYAWELFASAPFPEGGLRRAMEYYVQIQKEVFFGQQLDLTGSSDVSLMHQLKTGSYTVRGPLGLGALLAGASEAQLSDLEAFGAPLGLAFQLRDDLLGTFGNPDALGKPIGNDLRAGKRTALIREAETLLDAAARKRLQAVLGRADASDEEVASAARLLVDCGAKANVEASLNSLVDEARRVLDGASFSPEGKDLLWQVAQLLAVRDR